MPFKRPAGGDSASDSSESSREGAPKRRRSSSPWNTEESSPEPPTLRVHILSAKIDPHALSELFNLVEGQKGVLKRADTSEPAQNAGATELDLRLELARDVHEADIIVTAVHMRQRLERHMKWEIAKTKAIVSPKWLEDSVKNGRPMPCGDYAALRDLREETAEQCPDQPGSSCDSSHPKSPSSTSVALQSPDPAGTPDPADIEQLTYTSRYCCARASPLVCPNQELVRQLDIIRQSRSLEGEERSMLSYSRAISVIKAYPYVVSLRNLREELPKLPYLGEKLLSMIEEFVKTRQISEAQTIRESSRFQALSAFSAIHGIGPHTARRLHALGLSTVEELERYYDVVPGVTDENTLFTTEADSNESEEAANERSIRVALSLRHDFSRTIPREEVEEINKTVMHELSFVEKGCKSIIVGGYRRGKPESNDVDIVITHTDWTLGSRKVKGLCKRLVQRLYERGLITHVMHLSGFHEHNALRTHHWDSLEKALTVFVLPEDSSRRRVYRRLDLIFAAPEVFWTAVVGWTGSTMFQRDLRLWAKQQKGMKFDSSGISRRHDSKLFFPKTEREVFELLGLAYVHPTLRNADA
ncbi:Nucleotidyltransferase [Leucogyrophana mollusca]|uniref:Nucleotidyltransferase n=1 Tax=Leucogyrophana mollusca TaxID=85980 RepID=A0ACB8B6R3_9AGAM|nr:Nucleotidyltransferase [Leucogyrophana mollusca]